jgi:hypothetical protein
MAEDSRPQRLVRGRAGHAVPARQPADARQATGPDDQGRPALGANVGAQDAHRPQPGHLPHDRRPAPARQPGRGRWRQDHDRLDAEQSRAPSGTGQAGQPRRPQGRLSDRAHRTHGHRDQLPHVGHCGRRRRPFQQRSRSELPQPRCRQPLRGGRQFLLFLGCPQSRPHHRGQRAPRRAHHHSQQRG